MQKNARLSIYSLLILAASPAMADDFYAGATVGLSSIDIPSSAPLDDRAGGWKVFAGYEFSDLLALEGGYTDLGSFDGSETFGDVTDRAKIEISGIDLFLVGSLPVGPIDAFAKLGVVDWEIDFSGSTTDATNPGPPVTFNGQEDGTDLAAGLGLRYELSDNFRLRGEVEWFDVDDIDGVFAFSLGAVFTF